MANFSSEAMWGRRQWNANFQVLKEKKAFKLGFFVKKKCVSRKCIKDISEQIKIEGIPVDIHYNKF